MDRITGANATIDNRFQDGNAGTGQRATSFNATWANGVQEELMTIITAGGLAGNAAVFDLVLKAMVNVCHPVGEELTLNNNTNPNALWPWQTWVEDTTGRVTASRDPAQVEFDTTGKQGGAKTVALTVAQMPAHKHVNGARTEGGEDAAVYGITAVPAGQAVDQNGGGGYNTAPYTSTEGEGAAHNNLQPYIVRRKWIRTA